MSESSQAVELSFAVKRAPAKLIVNVDLFIPILLA